MPRQTRAKRTDAPSPFWVHKEKTQLCNRKEKQWHGSHERSPHHPP